ncbi:MAG: hypothetical protein E7182_03970 [Erysipelotrichaceae bacterium]|nr:hypothetical protein [Erysipelotrichaceae bacterium]
MPKLTKEELQRVRYVSMADFARRFDQIQDFDDKMSFATRYLLCHGMKGAENDYSFPEALHIARTKIADASARMKEQFFAQSDEDLTKRPHIVNPWLKDERADLAAEAFMGNPTGYVQGAAKELAQEMGSSSGFNIDLKANCERISHLPEEQTNRAVFALDATPTAFDVKMRLETKLGGRAELESLYQTAKPGLFSRILGASSPASHKLDAAYKAFQNPRDRAFGDMNAMEKASNDYLGYKIPTWKPGQKMPNDVMGVLNPAEKARAKLSVYMLESIEEQRAMEDDFRTMVKACSAKSLSYDDVIASRVTLRETSQEEPHVEDAVKEETRIKSPRGLDQASFQSFLEYDAQDETLMESRGEATEEEPSIDEPAIDEAAVVQ